MTDDRNERVAKKWDEQSKKQSSVRTRWWAFPTIHRHINQRVCGEPIEGFSQGVLKRLRKVRPETTYERGVSVGCGAGQKEMTLVRQGVVGHFDLYELSPVRIEQGRARAEALGISKQVTFHLGNAFESDAKEVFDFVHWNNSLHHMYDVDSAIKWSRDVLVDDGVFYMDDFIGAKQFQWSRSSLVVATMVRCWLPSKYLVNPHNPSKKLPRIVRRPDRDKLIADDPSEAADSDKIIPSLSRHFPEASVTRTGGAIYHLALNDVLANIDEESDQELLQRLLRLDARMADFGETHFAVALAFK